MEVKINYPEEQHKITFQHSHQGQQYNNRPQSPSMSFHNHIYVKRFGHSLDSPMQSPFTTERTTITWLMLS